MPNVSKAESLQTLRSQQKISIGSEVDINSSGREYIAQLFGRNGPYNPIFSLGRISKLIQPYRIRDSARLTGEIIRFEPPTIRVKISDGQSRPIVIDARRKIFKPLRTTSPNS